MRYETKYEWTVEGIDENGDIVDSEFSDSLAGIIPSAIFMARDYPEVRVGLVKDIGNDEEGLVDRTWAYLQGRTLPAEFEDGVKVPKYILNMANKEFK